MILEYFPTIEETKRNPCSVREQIIGIAMVSKRDFDNVTYDWICNIYAFVNASLKCDSGLNYQHLSFHTRLLQTSAYLCQHFKAKSDFGR